MIPENERIEFEDRTYVNPEVSLQEQNAFIDNLRNVQNQNNAEIATDTYNLGTAIPSNLGGLGGGESYFTSRYQVPQGVALANNLRATAQAQALNDILSNEQAMMKQRYTNAQRAARQRAAASYGGGNDAAQPDVEKNIITPENFYGPPDTIVSENDTHYIYTDPKTGEQTKVSKDYMKKIYDDNGNITNDGMVILDTRRMLGL